MSTIATEFTEPISQNQSLPEGLSTSNENKAALQNILKFCQELQKLFAGHGYRVVLSGRTAQYLLKTHKPDHSAQLIQEASQEKLVLNDLDFVLVGIPDVRDSGKDISQILKDLPSIHGITVLTAYEVVRNAVKHGAHAANAVPDSTTIKGFTEINGQEVEVEFFLGNESGFGYQAKDINFNNSRPSFDPLHTGATATVADASGETIEVVSSAGLLLYYIAINKQHRIRELLVSYKDDLSILFENSAQINPELRAKLQLAEQYYSLTHSIEKVAELLGHSDVSVELALGICQAIKNIGNSNAGEVIKKLRLPISQVSEQIRYIEHNPLIEAALAKVLECFPSQTQSNEFRRLPKTYKALEEQLAAAWTKLLGVNPEVVRNQLQNLRKKQNDKTKRDAVPQQKGYIFFLQQMIDNLKRASHETLSFHGWHHAINTGLVSLALVEKEQIVPESERQEMATATMLVGLFHDIGIAITRGYANHELVSSYFLAVFIEKISKDPARKSLLTDSLLKKIKVGMVALFGTAINFDAGVRIGAELSLDEFKASVTKLVGADKISAVPTQMQESLSSENYLKIIREVLGEAEAGGLLDKWYRLLSVSDVSGVLTKTCFLGTYELSLEEGKLANRPLGGVRIGASLITSLQRYLETDAAANIRSILDRDLAQGNITKFAAISNRLTGLVDGDAALDREATLLKHVEFVRKLLLFYMKLHNPKDEPELVAA